jgi:hypothetical protein
MSRDRWLPIVLSAACALSCGAEQGADGEATASFDLYVSRVVIEQIGGFQLSLRRSGGCSGISRTTCLHEQVQPSELVTFTNAQGNKVRALRVDSELTQEGGIYTQDVTLRNVPVGRDYALVVEAYTRADPPLLLNLSCTPGIEVRRGANVLRNAQPIDLPEDAALPRCAPRID